MDCVPALTADCPTSSRVSAQTGGLSGPLLEAEEGDGARLRAGVRQGHDGGAETTGPGSDPGWGRRRRLSVPADSGTSAAGGGVPGSQQHPGEEVSVFIMGSN